MIILELKTYTRDELYKLFNIDNLNHNASRKLKQLLNKSIYTYETLERKKVKITGYKDIKEALYIIMRELNLCSNRGINLDNYTALVYKTMTDNNFTHSHRNEQLQILKEEYNVNISNTTLTKWMLKLRKVPYSGPQIELLMDLVKKYRATSINKGI